jgi:hypothetical protein
MTKRTPKILAILFLALIAAGCSETVIACENPQEPANPIEIRVSKFDTEYVDISCDEVVKGR